MDPTTGKPPVTSTVYMIHVDLTNGDSRVFDRVYYSFEIRDNGVLEIISKSSAVVSISFSPSAWKSVQTVSMVG